jgi:hypothetical protein
MAVSTHAPLHAVRPESHAMPQVLAEQVAFPFDGGWQTIPQSLQLSALCVTSTQEPEHALSPPGQAFVQPVGAQTSFTLQVVVQLPQWFGSACRFTHCPLQFENPVSHTTPHLPAEQTAEPWSGGEHVLPQPPQFSISAWKFTQTGPHRLKPGQVKSHVPRSQSGLPPAGAVHDAPQASQFAMSPLRFAQWPEHTVWPSPQATGPPSVPPGPEPPEFVPPEPVPPVSDPPVPGLASFAPLPPAPPFPGLPPVSFGSSSGCTHLFVFVLHTQPGRHSCCAPLQARPLKLVSIDVAHAPKPSAAIAAKTK